MATLPLTVLLTVLALPPLSAAPAGHLCLLPLLHRTVTAPAGLGTAAANGALVGGAVGAWAFWGAFSDGALTYLACIVLAAMPWAVFAALARELLHDDHNRHGRHTGAVGSAKAALALGALWMLAESALNVLGLPFSLALVVVDVPGLRHLAAVGGAPLTSFALVALQVLMHATVRALLTRQWPAARNAASALGVHLLLTALLAGVLRVSPVAAAPLPFSILVAQTDLPADVVADPAAPANLGIILHEHRELRAAAGRWFETHHRPYVLVWPESSLPMLTGGVPNDATRQAATGAIGELRHVYRVDGGGDVHSEIRVYAADGTVTSVSGKRRPVPLAEATLVASDMPALPHFVGGSPVGSLICYEAALSTAARELVHAGAHWLLVSSNDAYQGASFLTHMTLGLLRLRAIETGVPIVRAANGGDSVVVSPQGDVAASLGLYRRGLLDATPAGTSRATPYVKIGAVTTALPLLAGMLVLLGCRRSGLEISRRTLWRARAARSAPNAPAFSIVVTVGFSLLAIATQHLVALAAYRDAAAAHRERFLVAPYTISALRTIARHYGFAHPRLTAASPNGSARSGPLDGPSGDPYDDEALAHWASSHGLVPVPGSIDAYPPRVRHAVPGLLIGIDEPRPDRASIEFAPVIVGRHDGLVRLYLPLRDRNVVVPEGKIRERYRVLWFLPDDMQVPSAATQWAAESKS